MIGNQAYQSWTLSDEFWEKIEPYIPKHQREPSKNYKRKPGGGRKPPDYREILEKILYVLRTGCQWKSIKNGSNVHRYFQIWSACGFFEGIWAAGLYEYDELRTCVHSWKCCAAEIFLCQTRRDEGEYRNIFNRGATKYGAKISGDTALLAMNTGS